MGQAFTAIKQLIIICVAILVLESLRSLAARGFRKLVAYVVGYPHQEFQYPVFLRS